MLIQAIYPNLNTTSFTPDFLTERAILSTRNSDVDAINSMATEMMHSEYQMIYRAVDTIPEGEDNAGNFPTEYLNSVNISSLPPYLLALKVGQPIILLRNMNRKQGLCNGTRLIIRHLKDRLIGAEIMHGDRKGDLKWIPRIPLITNDDDGQSPVKFCRLQLPVRPAFAMTINKAQGQTLSCVGLYLPEPVFGHGQLYVALSRCSDPSRLKVLIKNGSIPNKQGTYTVIPAMLYSRRFSHNLNNKCERRGGKIFFFGTIEKEKNIMGVGGGKGEVGCGVGEGRKTRAY